MNGVHDLGGMHGFGPVEREADEPLFHAEWEKRVFGILGISTYQHGYFHWDEMRSAIERMAPAEYLASTYYERWLAGAERSFVEAGAVTEAELADRVDRLREASRRTGEQAKREDDIFTTVTPPLQSVQGRNAPLIGMHEVTPRFGVGDAVVARNINPVGHTRLPRYVRGKRGVIHRVHDGVTLLPDTNSTGESKDPQVVYSVRFEGRELWGEAAEPGQLLYLDMFEGYLDPAQV